jgi:hypothetical protein
MSASKSVSFNPLVRSSSQRGEDSDYELERIAQFREENPRPSKKIQGEKRENGDRNPIGKRFFPRTKTAVLPDFVLDPQGNPNAKIRYWTTDFEKAVAKTGKKLEQDKDGNWKIENVPGIRDSAEDSALVVDGKWSVKNIRDGVATFCNENGKCILMALAAASLYGIGKAAGFGGTNKKRCYKK